jgi:hypothetical protein
MSHLIVYSFLVYISFGCQQFERKQTFTDDGLTVTQIDTSNIAKVEDIILPNGYTRVNYLNNHFGTFLRAQKFDPDNTVHLFNGQEKSNQKVAFKVLNIDVGNKDLQQCADAVIRLRAEYLFEQKKYDKICFKFTNGQNACWKDYARGMRATLKGNNIVWKNTAAPDSSYKNFRSYLDLVFNYCGTQSLHRDLKSPKTNQKIEAGDVFIQTKQPFGHAVIVMDVAEDKSGNSIFLLAQSYMPAQQIHILKNFNNSALSPWYSLKDTDELITPEWEFKAKDRKMF